ncbi:MAG: hypothetical protein J6B26_01065 [Agathobacter sp.]|nr:hypothetical protein [Agathobacter sp.]
MKKKYLLMGVAGALVVSTMIGGTLAALDTVTTEGAKAEISVKSIGVSVNQANGAKTVDGSVEIKNGAVPGGNYECSYNVSNTETDGYDIYVKVAIYKYWEDEEGTLESKYDSVYFDCADGSEMAYPQELEESYLTENGWLVQYADEEQIVLYYTNPLKASDDVKENTSTNFMDGISFDPALGNAYANKELKIDYEITAVQANNSKAAMAAEWGMFPVFDKDGVLLGVYETEAEALAVEEGLAE